MNNNKLLVRKPEVNLRSFANPSANDGTEELTDPIRPPTAWRSPTTTMTAVAVVVVEVNIVEVKECEN